MTKLKFAGYGSAFVSYLFPALGMRAARNPGAQPTGTNCATRAQVICLPLVVVAVAALLATVLPVYRNSPPIRSDGMGYHIWTRALLEGDLSFRKYSDVPGVHVVDGSRNRLQNKYPPGVALLRFPVMAFLVRLDRAGPLVSKAEHRASLVLSALALLATLVLAQQACQKLGLDPFATGTGILTITFGTGLFHYGTFDGCFSHIYSAFVASALLWFGVRAGVSQRGQLPVVPVAILGCLFLLIRNTNLIILASLAGAYLVWRAQKHGLGGSGRDLAAILTGIAAGAGVQLAYNYYAYQAWSLTSYGNEPFVWDRPMQASVLFSYERGLFTFYPVVAVVLISAALVRRTRAWAAGFALLLLAYTCLYGYWSSWMLGSGFGHRGFVEVMPLALVLFAGSLTAMSRALRIGSVAIASICTILTLQFMVGYWQDWLPMEKVTSKIYWDHVYGTCSLLGTLFRLPLSCP